MSAGVDNSGVAASGAYCGDDTTEKSVQAGQQGAHLKAEDRYREASAKRDYLPIMRLSIVALPRPLVASMCRDPESIIGVFIGGIFELLNSMWWGIAIGVIFVGIFN